MENRVEKIINEYEEGIKNIDAKYEVKEVEEPKKADIHELEDKIQYYKNKIAQLEYEGEKINKDFIDKLKGKLEVAEEEKKEKEEKYAKSFSKYKKAIEERDKKVLEMQKMKHSYIEITKGKKDGKDITVEVTMAEKDEMDKQDLKDKAIRELKQESKAISEELLKKEQELKTVKQEFSYVNYNMRIGIKTRAQIENLEEDEVKKALKKNASKIKELKVKIAELSEEISELSKVQEQCNDYLEQLQMPTEKDQKFSEAWSQAKKDEEKGEAQQGEAQQGEAQQGEAQQRQAQQRQAQQRQPQQSSNKNPNIRIIYTAKTDEYMIQDINDPKKFIKLTTDQLRTEEKNPLITRENLAKMANMEEEELQNVDMDIISLIQKSKADPERKVEARYKQYVDLILNAKENGLKLEYDLKGLYSNKDITPERRRELLGYANYAKEAGIAKVRKGIITTVCEKADNIIYRIKNSSVKRLEAPKNKTATKKRKFKKDVELTSEYKNISDRIAQAKESELNDLIEEAKQALKEGKLSTAEFAGLDYNVQSRLNELKNSQEKAVQESEQEK